MYSTINVIHKKGDFYKHMVIEKLSDGRDIVSSRNGNTIPYHRKGDDILHDKILSIKFFSLLFIFI